MSPKISGWAARALLVQTLNPQRLKNIETLSAMPTFACMSSQSPGKALEHTLSQLVEGLTGGADTAAVITFSEQAFTTTARRHIGQQAARLSAGLRADGLEKGENVVLLAPASVEFFIATLAIIHAGGVVVPVDVQMSDEHLCHVFENSASRRVFTHVEAAKRLRQLETGGRHELYLMDGDDGTRSSWTRLFADKAGPAAAVKGSDMAILFYTSGTTGCPKGVPLSHDNLLFQIRTVEKSGLVNARDRMLLPLPLHHVYPMVIGVLTPLALGVPIILPHALTGGAVTRALREGRATLVLGVPRLYRAIFNGIRDKFETAGRVPGCLFAGLLAISRLGNRVRLPLGRRLFRAVHQRAGPDIRLLACGGAPLDPTLARNLEALGWPVTVGYGLTETAPLLTLRWPGESRHHSVGKAIEGVELKIDPAVPSHGEGAERNPAAADSKGNAAGELLARGPNVFSGYHRMPEETGRVFEDGWFRTGDMARVDTEGYVYLQGRVSTMIVLEGGENIDPEKIEAAYEACAEVAEAGVLEDAGKLAALVVPEKELLRQHAESDLPGIIRQAFEKRAARLPSYQRVGRIQITSTPLERTRLGKLRRKNLAAAYARVKAGESRADNTDKGPIPENKMSSSDRALLEDARVRKLWNILSKRYTDTALSPDSHVEFDLGVDSLEWVELSLAIEEQLKVAVEESWYQQCHHVRDLMQAVAESVEQDSAVWQNRSRRPLEDPESIIPARDQRWAAPRNWPEWLIGTAIYGMLSVLMKLFFRIEARGFENIPRDGCYMLTPNHISYLDAPAVGFAMGYRHAKRCFWAGWSGLLFRNFFWRGISRLAQVIPIKREQGPVSSLSFGALVLKRQRPLVWFPQGQISPDGSFQPFRQGIGLLLEHYSPPVIPVYIEGTDHALPPGRLFPRPAKVTVHFGKPIDIDKLKMDGMGTGKDLHGLLTKHLQDAVAALGKG